MNARDLNCLPDVQATPDARKLAIQHVGVKGLRYPITILDHSGELRSTVATFAMTVALPADVKGTHMSRFIELLEQPREPLSLPELRAMYEEMLVRLEAESGRIQIRFPFFINKTAPVSGVSSLLDMDAGIDIQRNPDGLVETTVQVTVPVTSLCPCSKKISAYGAHNQRSHLTLSAGLREDMSLTELVRIAEEEASCEVFGLLKRPDEKWVTERAYDNPKFVEDLVRDIALRLSAEERVETWSVAAENFESIHNHSAYAVIEGRNA
jgi:GTP cyclohydrolase IB